MAQFIFTYHGGRKPESPEEGERMMQEWQHWAAGLGPALINPGNPVGITKVLTAEGPSDMPSPHPIMGFSILEAEDMDQALQLLGDCPHFQLGGTLEISEMMEMPS
ncbi:hypothetical protein [Motiliproteus sp.]|uniref:hypothetical protein n=1 Tax=Motiliproteus sp. TaxID=1898955 RepID=UPI003BA89F3D